MGFADTFFSALEIAQRPVLDVSGRLSALMPARELVPRWFVMLYQVARATDPVLRYARRHCDHGDRFGADLYDFLCRKVDEEKGHDSMLADDLERVGVSAPDSIYPNPFIAEMVGRQYYLIDFVDPAAYLGFIGLLEGFPPKLAQVNALQEASGYPPEAFSMLRLHADVDVDHRNSLAQMLDSVPQHLHPDILSNGIRCAALQASALELLFAKQSEETTWTK